MNNNSGRKWTLWVAGIVFVIISSIVGFMGRGVVANEKECTRRNIDAINRDVKVERRIGDTVKEGFKDVLSKMDKMNVAQHSMEISIKGIEKDVEYLKGQ